VAEGAPPECDSLDALDRVVEGIDGAVLVQEFGSFEAPLDSWWLSNTCV